VPSGFNSPFGSCYSVVQLALGRAAFSHPWKVPVGINNLAKLPRQSSSLRFARDEQQICRHLGSSRLFVPLLWILASSLPPPPKLQRQSGTACYVVGPNWAPTGQHFCTRHATPQIKELNVNIPGISHPTELALKYLQIRFRALATI
jgi:hypothetical protein